MATDMFMIYQINDAEKNREYRCRSYAYQIEHEQSIQDTVKALHTD